MKTSQETDLYAKRAMKETDLSEKRPTCDKRAIKISQETDLFAKKAIKETDLSDKRAIKTSHGKRDLNT